MTRAKPTPERPVTVRLYVTTAQVVADVGKRTDAGHVIVEILPTYTILPVDFDPKQLEAFLRKGLVEGFDVPVDEGAAA